MCLTKYILAGLIALIAFNANAEQYVGLHTISMHGMPCSSSYICQKNGGWNQRNFGAYYRTNNYIIGGYENSIFKTSLYAAGLLQTSGHRYADFGSGFGVISGYVKTITHLDSTRVVHHTESGQSVSTTNSISYTSKSAIMPLVFMYASVHVTKSMNLNINYVPKLKQNGNVLHFTLEYKF